MWVRVEFAWIAHRPLLAGGARGGAGRSLPVVGENLLFARSRMSHKEYYVKLPGHERGKLASPWLVMARAVHGPNRPAAGRSLRHRRNRGSSDLRRREHFSTGGCSNSA